MEIFIKEFRTINELLLKEQSNLLSELKIEVNKLSKVMSNVLIPKYKVNGVKTRGGKMTSEAAPNKEINETRINKNKPPRFEQDVQEKPHDVVVKINLQVVPPKWTFKKRKRFFLQVKTYFWEEPYAFKLYADNIVRRCVAGSETLKTLAHCHSGPTSRHHSASVTEKKGTYLQGMKCLKITFRYVKSLMFGNYILWEYFPNLEVGDKVLLYNSRLKMYPKELKSKWSGPNIIKTVYPYGAVEIIDKNGCNFKVSGQRLKKYYEGDVDKEDDEVIEFENGVT
nr:hypothetical protein [Tanacetum cinerariifolium]